MALPLSGCRVLDLGIITAGAGASAVLADLGAEVIKIKSASYRDPFRRWPSNDKISETDGDSPFFRCTNRNKRSVSLDLKTSAGCAAFLRLVANCDVVVENFRRGALDRLGLGFKAMASVNPKLILASISSQGESGPDANHVSFGSTLEAMGGLAWVTGYDNDAPVITGRELNYPDQVATIFAAGMIATAIRAQRTNPGAVHLDLSQRELTTFLCGDEFGEGGSSVVPRRGNAHRMHWLQDCFRAKSGGWIAVTVDESERPALLELVPFEGNNSAAAAEGLTRWAAGRPAADAVADLLSRGIAAAPVVDGHGVMHSASRLWRDALRQDFQGALVKGFPFQIRETPLSIYLDARPLGTDTVDVLRTIGGLGDEEIKILVEAGVVETAKPGAPAEPSAALAGGG